MEQPLLDWLSSPSPSPGAEQTIRAAAHADGQLNLLTYGVGNTPAAYFPGVQREECNEGCCSSISELCHVPALPGPSWHMEVGEWGRWYLALLVTKDVGGER